MAQIDALSPAERTLIHDFNVNPVVNLVQMGMKNPEHIRDVLTTRERHGDDAARDRFEELMCPKPSVTSSTRSASSAPTT